MGEGWNLSLGAISWAEHNVETVCKTCTPLWEDSWQLSDAFGTAADLIPPNINVSTYHEDSGNPITPNRVTWHTAPETRAKVISIQGQSVAGVAAPCFRVWLPNGTMEEFGCTWDSLQYYVEPSGPNTGVPYLANWLLDLITDPSGNQIHITYQGDVATAANGELYPRDAVPATVEWDSPGCRNAQTACSGSAWSPLMRVNFAASHAVTHTAGANCGVNGNLRCDDPVDLSGSGGAAAPTVQSTFVLDDVQVQVRPAGSAVWNTLRDYQLGYDQSGPSTITDPVTGLQQSTAGKLNLTRLTEIGDDGATTLPARTFGYTQQTEYYVDSLGAPTPSTNCGPSWNTGITPNGHHTCLLWSQSYAGNNSYLSSVSNGLGLAESYTWQNARNNFHGVVGGGSNTSNPFYCDSSSVQSTYPCNLTDDGSWSRMVLTQQSDTVVRLTQSGQGGSQTSTPVTSTTAYSYQVPYPLQAQECPDSVASFYWGNQNDFDLLDFYNARFMGFSQTTVSNPDGSVDVHKYLSTEGFGIYDTSQVGCDTKTTPCHNDPWSDLPNAAHGHEIELDSYATDGTTLLSQVKTQYQAVCPPAGVTGTPPSSTYGNWHGGLVSELDHSNPTMVCEVQPQQVDNYTFEGPPSPCARRPPTSTTATGGRSAKRRPETCPLRTAADTATRPP